MIQVAYSLGHLLKEISRLSELIVETRMDMDGKGLSAAPLQAFQCAAAALMERVHG